MSIDVQLDLFSDPSEDLAVGRRRAIDLAQPVTEEPERLALARAFCTKALNRYWAELTDDQPPRPMPAAASSQWPAHRCTDPLQSLAAELGATTAALPPELACHAIGRL